MKNIIRFLIYIKINNDTIKLKKGKYLLFRFIYSLKQVKLEILKIYIKTSLTNGFI